MNSIPELDPKTDLVVWPTAKGAFLFGLSMIRYAAVAGAIVATVVALMMVAGLLPLPASDTKDPAAMMSAGPVGDIVLLALSFLLTAVFTVFFHRRVMLGLGAAARPRMAAREWRFLAASLLYTLAVFVPGGVVMMGMAGGAAAIGVGSGPVMMVLVFLALALFVFLFVRFALAFPAIAVDAPGSLLDQFKNSFVATKGHAGTLFGIYVVAYFLFLSMAIAVAFGLGIVVAMVAVGGASVVVVTWISLFIQITLQFMALAMFASIASRAFMAWSGWQPPGDDAVAVAS